MLYPHTYHMHTCTSIFVIILPQELPLVVTSVCQCTGTPRFTVLLTYRVSDKLKVRPSTSKKDYDLKAQMMVSTF